MIKNSYQIGEFKIEIRKRKSLWLAKATNGAGEVFLHPKRLKIDNGEEFAKKFVKKINAGQILAIRELTLLDRFWSRQAQAQIMVKVFKDNFVVCAERKFSDKHFELYVTFSEEPNEFDLEECEELFAQHFNELVYGK